MRSSEEGFAHREHRGTESETACTRALALLPVLSENACVRIVLVRPRDPNNIGAVARAMANFGFDDLVVVDAWDPTWREAKSAVGAAHVLESARSVATLDEAIGDCRHVMATTAATGRRLSTEKDPPAAFASMREQGIEPSQTAILFGNEKHGLTSDELDRAHSVVVIPTSERQPSMNLSQAVTLMVWEASRAFGVETLVAEPAPPTGERRATIAEIERLVEAATGTKPGAVELARPAAAAVRFRRLLLRSNPSAADIQLLYALLNSPSDNESQR